MILLRITKRKHFSAVNSGSVQSWFRKASLKRLSRQDSKMSACIRDKTVCYSFEASWRLHIKQRTNAKKKRQKLNFLQPVANYQIDPLMTMTTARTNLSWNIQTFIWTFINLSDKFLFARTLIFFFVLVINSRVKIWIFYFSKYALKSIDRYIFTHENFVVKS